jgi:hypothetical protein
MIIVMLGSSEMLRKSFLYCSRDGELRLMTTVEVKPATHMTRTWWASAPAP